MDPQHPIFQQSQVIPPQSPQPSSKIPLFIGISILLFIIGVGTYFLGKRPVITNNKLILTISPTIKISSPSSPISPIVKNNNSDKYYLTGSEVMKASGGRRSVLFKNVSNVSEVRLGPDGKTLHFKLKSFNSQKPQELCADLESKIEPVTPDYKDPPPATPPWDYQTIAHFGTVNHCNTYHAGGYLKNSDYFAYLKLISPTQGQLYYENLKTGELKQLSVRGELLTGFNDEVDPVGNTPGKVNSYWVNAIVGKDGFQYFYPQLDSYLQNNSLVLAFGPLILAINIQKNNFIGDYVQQDVVGISFQFLSQDSLPFIVVESAWEGPPKFNEIIDVNNDKLKIINLAELDKRSFFGFKVDPIVWETNDVVLNFTDFEDATKKLPSNYDFNNLPINDSVKMDQINNQAELLLKNNYGYLEVKCSLGPGMFVGCDGLKKINRYRYSSLQGLIQF